MQLGFTIRTLYKKYEGNYYWHFYGKICSVYFYLFIFAANAMLMSSGGHSNGNANSLSCIFFQKFTVNHHQGTPNFFQNILFQKVFKIFYRAITLLDTDISNRKTITGKLLPFLFFVDRFSFSPPCSLPAHSVSRLLCFFFVLC